MSKISFSTEETEVTITRRIGKGAESTVTVSPEEAGIEINLGVGSIGATTDFGGAISLGIGGQNVTWGREGGTIHISIGGFEVNVEARDCIVTEIKSIFGNIVAQRSYPDPGCKPPDPPPPTPTPTPPRDEDEPRVPVPNDDGKYWAIVGEGSMTYFRTNLIISLPTIGSDIAELVEQYRAPVTIKRATIPIYSYQKPVEYRLLKGEYVRYFSVYVGYSWEPIAIGVAAVSQEKYNSEKSKWEPAASNDYIVLAFFGTGKSLNKFFEEDKKLAYEVATRRESYYITGYYFPVKVIPLKRAPANPFLPTGNKPPMQNCCEEILDYLADFEEAFDIQRMLKDKFPVSNSFMAPQCDPASVTVAKSFYEIWQCAFRTMAHGMIFEPRVNIKDADAAKAGDQDFKARYLNATGWASAMAEAMIEVKDDGNVSTNMDIRNGFAVTQTMVGLADAIYKLEAILDALGIELIPKAQTVETPYNLQIQIGKGSERETGDRLI